MIPKYEEWTIVLLGQWNVRLFTPEWTAPNLFEGQDIEVEFLVTSGVQKLRIRSQSVKIIPQDENLVVSVLDSSQETLDRAQAVAVRVLTLLEHTPVRALGVNFGFHEEDPGDPLLEAFQIGDVARLAGIGGQVVKTEVQRTFQIDGDIMNLRHTFESPGVDVHVNFHWAANGALDARETLTGINMTALRDRCLNMLEETYKAPLDPEEEDVNADDDQDDG